MGIHAVIVLLGEKWISSCNFILQSEHQQVISLECNCKYCMPAEYCIRIMNPIFSWWKLIKHNCVWWFIPAVVLGIWSICPGGASGISVLDSLMLKTGRNIVILWPSSYITQMVGLCCINAWFRSDSPGWARPYCLAKPSNPALKNFPW